MIDYLNAFGIGIAFSFGVISGATLAQLATNKGREDVRKDIEEHNKNVNDRLMLTAEKTGEIASYLKIIADSKMIDYKFKEDFKK